VFEFSKRCRHYELVSRSTQMNCPAGFQIMYAQLGSVSDANARLPKMSVIENKIPNTIPVSTVFIVKTPRNVRHISLGRACQKCAVGAVSSVTGAICHAIRRAHCSLRKLKLLVLVYRARPLLACAYVMAITKNTNLMPQSRSQPILTGI